ncbi:type II toxin-antitoxin system PemK/MazF family toxin [Phytohalomonas tamaricis]|uniref:type II toxin-antitoxin system PemK/MazF family toxin n=1 Tax=Phytohalomonas tamaricis TaxID=2081032 RepID=UPI000D0AFD37|nr:type II toxin-antitoxin system PemK/MazF family toxin [Phytohalomonas tamaricis]
MSEGPLSRGDLVTVTASGDYGKPRPALIIQSDHFDQHPSITLLPLTSHLRDTPLFRITVYPTPGNGLQKTSQIMIDKTLTVPRERIGGRIGTLDTEIILSVDRALTVFLGIAR